MYRPIHYPVVAGTLVLSLALFAGAQAARAQSGPLDGGNPSTASGPNQAPPRTVFTYQSLPEMFKSLGYSATARTNSKGATYWEVAARQDGWGFTVQVIPYGNDGKIFGLNMSSDVGRPVNPKELSVAGLLKLLEWNHGTAQDVVGYNPKSGCISLSNQYRAGQATVEELRAEFNGFFKSIRDSHGLWKNLSVGSSVAANPSPAAGQPAAGQPATAQPATGQPATGQPATGQPVAGQPAAPVAPGVKDIAGTVWKGSENLQGYGALTFEFHAQGKAVMIDTAGRTEGTWTRNGDEVTINFGGCAYRGRISGRTLSGMGENLSGNNAGKTWAFRVDLQNS
jgi:hypothetical protein